MNLEGSPQAATKRGSTAARLRVLEGRIKRDEETGKRRKRCEERGKKRAREEERAR